MKQSTQVVRVTLLTIMLVLTGGLLNHTRAQGQTCRDINQITVCGDVFTEITVNGGGFRLRGNVRIGPKGGAALVEVEDIGSVFDGTIIDPNISTASYFHFNQADTNSGTTDFILGDVRMINDVTGLTLMGTSVVPDPENAGNVLIGRLFVDTTNGKIFNPAAGAVPVFITRGITRNANIRLAFMTQVGAAVFYKEGGSVAELAKVNAEFNLFTRKFIGTMPVSLKLGESAENPNLEITIVSEFSETGVQTSKVNGFKFKLGGLLLDVSGATVKPPVGNSTAEFTAASVKALKTDNPGLPNLDPTDATLIFAFTNLKYKDGAWSLGGVEVPIKNWEVGPAFKMVNQTIGIVNENNSTVQAFQVKSTLQFGAGADASKLPAVIKIGRAQVGNDFKPIFSAGLGAISPKLGTLTFNLTGANFVGNAAQDFFGIQATSAAVQWPPHLGGKTAAAVNNFKIGTNQARTFVFQIGSGTIGLPEFENNLFKGNLAATLGMVQDTLTITGTGTLNIKLPGNGNAAGVNTTAIMRYNKEVDSSGAAAATIARTYEYQPVANTLISRCIGVLGRRTTCPGTTPPPPPPGPDPFEFKLTGFSMKIAGFGLTITNPKGTDDGGFTADNVGMTLPIGMLSSNSTSGIQVQGFGVSGGGNVSIQGGGFELAPISVGSVQFVGLKGTFIKKQDNSYEFTAAGKLPLPGIEPGTNSGGISVNITVKLAPSGSFNGIGVIVEFGSPPLPPIPIGSTGMNLVRVSGSFDLTNQSVTIGLGLGAASKFKIPLGALGTLPIATADGNVTTQFNPFKFTGNMNISVLIFQVASATVKIGAGEGFDGNDGITIVANVNAVLVSGEFRMRAGKGVAGNPDKRRFAANAKWVLGIPANQYGVGRPPFNLGGIQVNLGGGAFIDNNKNPAGEAIGVRGSVCGPNGNLCVGFFVNLGENMGSGDFLDFTNIDKYVLIPAAAVRAAAAAGQVGYASVAMTPQAAQEMGLVLAASQVNGTASILQETVDVVITETTTLLVGINYLTGNPTISLKLPNATVLTEDTVDDIFQTFLRETETVSDTTNLLFTISGATPGTYQLIINNAPVEYELVSYTLNSSPTANITDTVCGGANVPGLTVTCQTPIPLASVASPDATNATNVTVDWTASDSDSPNAKVAVGYVVDPGAPELVEYANINFVVEDLPLGPGSHVIDFSEVGTGHYRPVVVVDDQQNGIIIANSATTITVVDLLPPAIPAGLTATPQAGELLIKWDQNTEKDLAGYDIGFALVDDSSQFVYTRTMGPKEIVTGTNSIVDAKLWGLTDDTTVFYGLRAFDTSGNYSAWTPLQSAKPWALSPNTWNPVPNGAGIGGVEVAFDVAMVPESLDDELTVKDADGNVLPGEYYFLLNAEGTEVVGVGFIADRAYDGAATATLKGGEDGAKSEAGKTMGGNYSWSFAWQFEPEFNGILMPLLFK